MAKIMSIVFTAMVAVALTFTGTGCDKKKAEPAKGAATPAPAGATPAPAKTTN